MGSDALTAQRTAPAIGPTRAPRIYAFPSRGIAYCDALYPTVARLGVDAVEGRCSVRWVLASVRPGDALHVHWPSFLYHEPGASLATWRRVARLAALLAAARLRGARVLWTAHNLYPHEGGSALPVHRVARRVVVRLSHRIFAHGPTAAALVAAEFGAAAAKLVVVPHGHWIDHYPPARPRATARAALGMPDGRFVYGVVGHLKPYKRLEALLDVVEQLPSRHALLVAGLFADAGYRRAIEARVARMPAERVVLRPGFLGGEELRDCVCAVDALVLPYRAILTSGSALLALGFGRPVVAPRLGGLADVVRPSNGVLYDAGAPDGLRDALREVAERRFDAEALVARARSFDWNETAARLVEAIR